MIKVRGAWRLEKEEKTDIIRSFIHDERINSKELEEKVINSNDELYLDYKNYINNVVLEKDNPKDMQKATKKLANAVESYINGDGVAAYLELGGNFEQKEIIKALKSGLIKLLNNYRDKLVQDEKAKKAVQINEIVNEIDYTLDNSFYLNIFQKHYEDFYDITEILETLYVFFKENYKPISETVYQIREYKDLLNSLQNQYCTYQKIAFNVKLNNAYPSLEEVKDILLEEGKINKTDYDNMDSYALFDEPYSPWSLFNMKKWQDTEKYLLDNYDRIEKVEQEGKNGGWLVIKYPQYKEEQLKLMEKLLETGEFEVGEEIIYSYELNPVPTLNEEFFEGLNEEIKEIRNYVEKQVKNYKEDYLVWLKEEYRP
jgi:hypothetical protein